VTRGRLGTLTGTACLRLALRQGSVEDTGDAVLGMVDFVTLQRAYAANIDALNAMDGVLATVAGQIDKV